MKKLICLGLCLLLLCGCAAETKGPYVPTGDGLASDKPTEPQGSEITEHTMSLAYSESHTLSPFNATDLTNRTLFSLIYQGLFAVDSNYTPNPVLCKSYTVSRDMTTYTFYLAEATFSDGKPVTAQDAAASLKAAATSAYYSGRFSYVEDISATDDALVITLTTPYENLPLLLDVPIVPKDQVNQERPIGSGPYLYEEYAGTLRLRRRTDWWCSAVLSVTGQIITLVASETPSQLRDAFEFSGLGVVCADPGSETYVDFHSDYELWDCETGVFLYLACNEESPLFSNVTLRQALTYAVNRDELVEHYYRDFGYSAYLPASPKFPYYSLVLTKNLGYAPEKFTAALASVEPEEKTVVFLVNKDDGIRLRAARTIAAGLTECGLKVTMSELATADYVAALENGEFDLYLGQTKLSANMDLSAFFQEEGTLSFGGMDDPLLYTLCQEALANTGNYYTLYKQILDDGMLCPLLFRSNAIFVQRGTFTNLYASRDNIFYYDLGTDSNTIRTIAE